VGGKKEENGKGGKGKETKRRISGKKGRAREEFCAVVNFP